MRILLVIAGLLVLTTAALHGVAYGSLSHNLDGSAMAAAWQNIVKGAWLVVAGHLLVVGALLILAGVRPASVGTVVLALLAVVPVVDTVLLYTYVGIFPGTISMGLASVLTGAAVAGRLRSERAG